MSWIARIPVGEFEADVVSSQLWDAGTTGVAQVASDSGEELLAGFDDEALASDAVRRFGGSVEPVDSSVWAREDTSTVTIEKPMAGTDEDGSIEDGSIELTLEVGSAFGHGGHTTTRLVLDAISDERRRGPLGSVLDVGCGTGVLGLAAAALEADAVVGIDIDGEAVAIAGRNAAANGLAGETVRFVETPVDEVDGTFDVVVANVLLAEIRPLTSAIIDRVGGRLILSGSLVDQRSQLIDAFAPLRVVGENQADGWLCLILTR